MGELNTIGCHNQQCQIIATERAVLQTQLAAIEKDMEAANAALIQWQNRVKKLQESRITVVKNLASNPEIQTANPAEVEANLKTLETTNAAIRTNRQRQEAILAHEGCVADYANLGDEIKVVENQKARKLAAVLMPVKELTIIPDGLAYRGIPLQQVNSAKQLEICVSISMAMNPRLKVLRINGNDLDTESLLAIGRIVDNQGYQIWIEKVSDDDKIGFYIEDGHLTETQNAN